MLTPQLIEAMNKATGNNIPLSPDAAPSRADQVRTIGKTAEPVAKPLQFASPSSFDKTVVSAAKGIVSPVATMVARPVQAVAELAGADADTVDKDTSKITHGLVAPVPRNAGDVEKDVGRGIETVGLGAAGAAPVAAGAALGAGHSLEEGNDLLSGQTAFQTALGGAGGKLLDLVGTPLFNAAGKAVGKITPPFLKDLSSQGSKAIQDFAAAHDILPDFASNAIKKGVSGAEDLAEKPFDAVHNAAQTLGDNYEKSSALKTATADRDGVIDLLKQNEETMTPTMKKEAIAGGRQTVKTNKIGGTEVDYAPTKEIERAADILRDPRVLRDPVTSEDPPNVVYAKTNSAIAQKGAQAEKFLEDNAVKVTNKEDFDMFKKLRDDADKTSTDTEMNAYDEQVKLFNKQLQGRGGYNTANYYKALKDWESNIADKLPRGKEALLDPTGVASAKIRAAADIRQAVRDLISSKHPEFQPKMYDLSSLYEAKDNALFNASKTKSKSFFEKHPTATKVGAAAVGGATLGELGRKAIGI